MTDISESGIEAAYHKASEAFWEQKRAGGPYSATKHCIKRAISAAIQAYLPFHPPASREEGLRGALELAGDALAAEANNRGDEDKTYAVPVAPALSAVRNALALIPTKPEAREPHWAARNEPDYADPARPPGAYATESKKPE